jgi:hypothetical protein
MEAWGLQRRRKAGKAFKAERVVKIDLQLFLKRLQFPRLLDNLSFRGMENLQVNVVQ